MEKLTGKQIIEKLKEIIDVSEFAYNDYDVDKLGLGKIEEVEQYGGEGQGDTWYSVKYFPDHDVYLKVNGWYQSYSGTDFNGWEDVDVVKPQQKTITVYE